jgi:hypothetical protein
LADSALEEVDSNLRSLPENSSLSETRHTGFRVIGPAQVSLTAVPKTFAWAAGSMISGYLLTLSTFGWPLVVGGVVEGVYDILLLVKFRGVRPPEEAGATAD